MNPEPQDNINQINNTQQPKPKKNKNNAYNGSKRTNRG